MQKELAYRDEKGTEKEECEEKVTATHRSTNSFVFIFPHVPPPYHHYPVAELRQTAPPARPSALPARPAVPSEIQTASHPQAAAAGGQEEEENPEMIPKSPNEEADDKRTRRLPPTKKRKTRNTVKEGNVSTPMVEVSRPDVVMVFRPWTVSGKLRGEDYHRMSSNWTMTKKERARAKTDKELQLALGQAVSRPGGYSAPQNQQMRGRRGKGRGGRPSSWTERTPKQRGCMICGTDDHLTRKCSKCKLCKKDDHWSRECPENQ
ncbi:hypothetical protein H4Q32_028916 [Labeo rohita]|uniref:CCHC-type domain-containing protein n=1 Tax=Labeo rohita TaxID=84645 RepID=A0ABQ8L003_LABRO|nr:hypothetical protein H4Q32_028916 [Labeo rohita]